MIETLLTFVPSTTVAVLIIVLLFVLRRILDRSAAASGHQARNQLILMGISAAGLMLVTLVMPLGDAARGQILGLVGIVLSAGIALSSTTFLGNAMAGIMLRAVRNFRMGDFIRTGEHFGRVSERGIFHTEIQTEDRELTTLPNLYLVTNPVTTIRSSGTIVSATVSLGYDVPRATISELLLEAAERAGLDEPFVQVLELGDFSVTYRIAGLLGEVKQILTARSRLRGLVMDALHQGRVEIVSPTFMNTRALAEDKRFIPKGRQTAVPEESDVSPESVVFDKAEEAESLEEVKLQHKKLSDEIAALEKRIEETPEDQDRGPMTEELSRLQSRQDRLDKVITGREAKVNDHD
jgi:small conductance mechanosensitive channel